MDVDRRNDLRKQAFSEYRERKDGGFQFYMGNVTSDKDGSLAVEGTGCS